MINATVTTFTVSILLEYFISNIVFKESELKDLVEELGFKTIKKKVNPPKDDTKGKKKEKSDKKKKPKKVSIIISIIFSHVLIFVLFLRDLVS